MLAEKLADHHTSEIIREDLHRYSHVA